MMEKNSIYPVGHNVPSERLTVTVCKKFTVEFTVYLLSVTEKRKKMKKTPKLP
jgi:hypothetical protein